MVIITTESTEDQEFMRKVAEELDQLAYYFDYEGHPFGYLSIKTTENAEKFIEQLREQFKVEEYD